MRPMRPLRKVRKIVGHGALRSAAARYALPWLLVGCILSCTGAARATETVLLNTSPARDCYLATVDGGAPTDIETCTLAIEHQMLVPEDLAATYSNRGILRVRNGDLAAGLRDHDRAVALAPQLTSVYINRSNALVAAKRYPDALADLERAIANAGVHLPVAYYNRALMFNVLGDREAARADAERAAELAPETVAYREFIQALAR